MDFLVWILVLIVIGVVVSTILLMKKSNLSKPTHSETARSSSNYATQIVDPRSKQYNETLTLLKNTTDCATFFGRIDFAYSIAYETHNQDWLDYLNNNANGLTRGFIDRAVSRELETIAKMKTEGGKQKHCDRFIDTMKTAFRNCNKPYAAANSSYLTEALKRVKPESSVYSITPPTAPSPFWSEKVSADVKDRFVTAVLLHNARKGIILGDRPEDYPQYYQYEFGITHPEQFHRKLISDGYLTYADVKTKLNYITIPKIKGILSNHSLPVSGNKEKLIQTALSNIDERQLSAELNNNKLTMLTENGESFLSFSEGYSELYRSSWQIYLYEYEALRKKGILNYTEAAEIILKERDKNPDFSTKLHLAELYYKQEQFSLSLAYYIQVMYYETDILQHSYSGEELPEDIAKEWAKDTVKMMKEQIADGSLFAPANQERIAKLAEHFSEDMINRCYTDNPKVKSVMSKQEFRKAVHEALICRK